MSISKRLDAIEDNPDLHRAALIQAIDHWISETVNIWDNLDMPEDEKILSTQWQVQSKELDTLLLSTDETTRQHGIKYLYKVIE